MALSDDDVKNTTDCLAEAAMYVHHARFLLVLLAFVLFGGIVHSSAIQSANALPAELSDADFWRMISEFSEPGGTYPYENFVSNEDKLQSVIPALKQTVKPGGVYLGVGPEQNFTYAAALEARMAFVIDIRRQNMIELLMYKALFELSPTRADFVSRLFSRRTPPTGRNENATAEAVFAAIDDLPADATYYTENLKAVKDTLSKHGFALTADDLVNIDYVYNVFYRGGPAINYAFASASPAIRNPPSYTSNMTATDPTGRNWSFLATEQHYRYVRELQRKNMIIPLVGNFAGPAVIRNIGRYLTAHNASVSAFYISNVESYLDAKQVQAFYDNVAALPIDPSSMFIRLIDGNHTPSLSWWQAGRGNPQAVSPMAALVDLIKTGRRPTYDETLRTVPDPLVLAGLSTPKDPDFGTGPLQLVPKGGPAPQGYTLIGTTRQTIQLLNGTTRTADFDVYTRK
jgi:hypothetical protein